MTQQEERSVSETIAELEPGTIFEDSWGDRFIVLWRGGVALLGGYQTRAFTYGEEDTTIEVLHTPEAPRRPLLGSGSLEATVHSLPLGTVFTELAQGSRNRFIKTSATHVAIDNGDSWLKAYSAPAVAAVTLTIDAYPSGVQEDREALFSFQTFIAPAVA